MNALEQLKGALSLLNNALTVYDTKVKEAKLLLQTPLTAVRNAVDKALQEIAN